MSHRLAALLLPLSIGLRKQPRMNGTQGPGSRSFQVDKRPASKIVVEVNQANRNDDNRKSDGRLDYRRLRALAFPSTSMLSLAPLSKKASLQRPPQRT